MISLVRKPRNRVADVNSAPVDLLANGSDKDEASNDRVHEIQISKETASNGAASVIGSSRSALGLFHEAGDTDSEIGNTKEQEEINAVVKQVLKGEGRAQNMVKLMALMSVPFIALITMSTITLVQVFTRFLNTKQIAGTVQSFVQVDSLIASLQVERGLSATYVTAGDNAFSTIQTLWRRYNATNHYIWSLSHWPDEFTYRGRSIADRQQFVELLREIRGRVAASRLSFDESTRVYTAINTQLMDIATYSVLTADRMWPYLVSASAMLRASDAMGIQRALGSSFFLLCRLRSDVYEWFMQLDGEVRSLQGMSFVYHPDIEREWGELLNRTLRERLVSLKSRIYSTEFSSRCENSSAEARADTSGTWFDSMTVYISQWKAIRMRLLDDIMAFIADDMSASQKEVVIYTICIGITLITFLLALTFSVNYAKNMKKLTSKIAEFAEQMALKSVELSREKKRTDLLLYQMLPKSVADQLRAKKEVLPQFFDHVTIYFSDIVGFTVICAKSTPMEVVAMLNGIYSAFDSSIDRYEVYKVETIGDAYMVVSGLPKPNPRHTREICLMALDLRQCLKGLRIPHLPEENFNLRIGIHTGSCVAGIVGLKMPRYCLFGDTVNTASRMESTGEAHKIHISDAVRKELEKEVGFRVLERGEIFVKGKGNMKTFWLLDYKDQYSP